MRLLNRKSPERRPYLPVASTGLDSPLVIPFYPKPSLLFSMFLSDAGLVMDSVN